MRQNFKIKKLENLQVGSGAVLTKNGLEPRTNVGILPTKINY